MAKGFDNLHVKSAIKDRNKFDLSRTHLTTMDFGQIVPLFCEETVPGDKFNISANYFSRMAPLAKPTYGKFNFKTMSVFVPYYQVADTIEAWLAGDSTFLGDTSSSRYITAEELHKVAINSECQLTGLTVTSGNCDYTYVNGSGTRYYIKWNAFGRYLWKVLNSLGYSAPENADFQTASTWYNTVRQTKFSALPFLAFCKAYNDWCSQAQKYNTSQLSSWLRNIKHDNSVTVSGSYYYYSVTHCVYGAGVIAMMKAIKLQYESDYFTSAWRYPNSALGGVDTEYNYGLVPGFDYSSISTDGKGGEVSKLLTDTVLNNYWDLTNYSYTTSMFGQRSLDWLKDFDDWVRRNNYSGSRAVQRIYSRFGIKTQDFRDNYAHVIDTDFTPIQVGDVTAQASTYVGAGNANNIELGDYAGKGIMNGNSSTQFEAKDYGMLFIFGWYSVTPMYAYGYDKTVLRTDYLDYYNPEFDGIGGEAISVGEVFIDPTNSVSSSTQDNSVFGYTERYNAYRFGKDKITGDFRKMKNDDDMNTWHTGRLLGDVRNSGNLVAQSESVNSLPQTGSEYNRIFSITDDSVDHFYMTAQFNVSAVRPMLSLNQVPRLGEGDTQVPRNGNTIN